MDISTFEKGLFESSNGYTFLTVVDRLKIAVLTSNRTKKERLSKEMHKFLEHELYI